MGSPEKKKMSSPESTHTSVASAPSVSCPLRSKENCPPEPAARGVGVPETTTLGTAAPGGATETVTTGPVLSMTTVGGSAVCGPQKCRLWPSATQSRSVALSNAGMGETRGATYTVALVTSPSTPAWGGAQWQL